MRYHTQNLNEDRNGNVIGSILWKGRAWLYGNDHNDHNDRASMEWYFGKHATGFAATIGFGVGDSDAGLQFHFCLPWLVSVYLTIPNMFACKECETGFAIHNGSIWFYPCSWTMESNHSDPWYRRSKSWDFPWTLKHHLTEILEHKSNLYGLNKAVWNDRNKKFLASYDERKAIEMSVSETYDYTYTRKNGEVQNRKATVHVDRMTWRARWFPFIPRTKVRTSINITFNDEVGEETGSWKGGCTGCGYDMQFGETPLEALRRMESERKF